MRLLGTAFGLALAGWLWAGSVASAAGAGSVELEFKQHEKAAHDAFVVGRYDEAVHEYTAAFALKPDPRVLYNLGLTHMKRFEITNDRQDLVMARQFFERFLALMSPTEPTYAQNRERNDKMRSLADEFLSTISSELEKRPAPASTESASAQRPSVPAAALEPMPLSEESHWRRYRTSYVLYGAAATVAAVATVTGILSLRAQHDAQDLRDAGSVADSLDKYDRADHLALTTDILFGVAAVTAGVGAYLQFRQWRSERQPPPASPRMALSMAPTGAMWSVHF